MKRFAKNILWIFWAWTLPGALQAQEPYAGGKEVCASEAGAWIQVPAQYHLELQDGKHTLTEDTSSGFAEIFYKVYADGQDIGAFLRPGKTTLIYFEGGPAGSALSRADFFKTISLEYDLNVVTFEIRGVHCSRPSTYESYLNIENYSALQIAGDAKVILDSLGVQEALVYGLSYGTFPARLFSHLFPDRTKATLLEGTLSLEDPSRREQSLVLTSLRDLYSTLFFTSHPKVLQFFSYLAQGSEEIFAAWSDRYLHNLSTVASNLGEVGLRQYAEKFEMSQTMEEFKNLVVHYETSSPWRTHSEASLDYYLLDLYLCRDFDRRGSISQSPLRLTRQGGLRARSQGGFSEKWNAHFAGTCLKNKLPDEQSPKALWQHHHGRLPLEKPVLLINGGLDASTPAESALEEARHLDGRVYFLEFETQGHAPWNLIQLQGEDNLKATLHQLLKQWFSNASLELSAEDVQILKQHRIGVRDPQNKREPPKGSPL